MKKSKQVALVITGTVVLAACGKPGDSTAPDQARSTNAPPVGYRSSSSGSRFWSGSGWHSSSRPSSSHSSSSHGVSRGGFGGHGSAISS